MRNSGSFGWLLALLVCLSLPGCGKLTTSEKLSGENATELSRYVSDITFMITDLDRQRSSSYFLRADGIFFSWIPDEVRIHTGRWWFEGGSLCRKDFDTSRQELTGVKYCLDFDRVALYAFFAGEGDFLNLAGRKFTPCYIRHRQLFDPIDILAVSPYLNPEDERRAARQNCKPALAQAHAGVVVRPADPQALEVYRTHTANLREDPKSLDAQAFRKAADRVLTEYGKDIFLRVFDIAINRRRADLESTIKSPLDNLF